MRRAPSGRHDAISSARARREAGKVDRCRVARDDDVRLQGGEPASNHLPPERGDVIVGAQRRRAEYLGVAGAGGPAVRPVEADPISKGSAKQLVDGDTERLCLEVPQRQFDPGDPLVGHAAEVRARDAIHVPVQPLYGSRVLADQHLLVIADRGGDAARVAPIAALAPAHQAILRLDLDEGPCSPASITLKRLDPPDLHSFTFTPSPPCPAKRTCSLSQIWEREQVRFAGLGVRAIVLTSRQRWLLAEPVRRPGRARGCPSRGACPILRAAPPTSLPARCRLGPARTGSS